jgi:hypothetical protein
MLLSYGGMRELEGAQALRRAQAPARTVESMSTEEMDAILGVSGYQAPQEDEISFDMNETLDSEIEASQSFRTPAVGGRFNVLRPPVHEPFRPPPPIAGPQGGNMRQVGVVGRFAILSDAGTPAPDYVAEARARLEDRMATEPEPRGLRAIAARATASQLNARQREHRAAVHETLPTAYDRILGDDPYDDDLE